MYLVGRIQISDEKEIEKLYFAEYARVETIDGKKIPFNSYLFAFGDELRRQKKFLKTINMDFPNVDGSFSRMHNNVRYDIGNIRFTGFLCEIDASSIHVIDIVDQVWLIMKQIFEKKGYKLTKLGFLIEDMI